MTFQESYQRDYDAMRAWAEHIRHDWRLDPSQVMGGVICATCGERVATKAALTMPSWKSREHDR